MPTEKECCHCNQPLFRRDKESKRDFDKRKFCGFSCSSKSRKGTRVYVVSKVRECSKCGGDFIVYRKPNKSAFSNRKLCDRCKKKSPTEGTKGELFISRKNWQSARSDITRHAKKTYVNANYPMSCYICGYDKHVQIAHRKSVSSFLPEASICEEINNVSNLVALCPNHHWEYDNGYINLNNHS